MTFTQKFKCTNCGKTFNEEIEEGMIVKDKSWEGVRIHAEKLNDGDSRKIKCPKCKTESKVKKLRSNKKPELSFTGIGM